MGQRRSRRNRLAGTAAATAAFLVTAGLAVAPASAAPPDRLQDDRVVKPLDAVGKLNATPRTLQAPQGTQAYLLKLRTAPTQRAFERNLDRGRVAARAAARAHLDTVEASQDRVTAELPSGSRVLYRTHSVMSGIAVRTDARNLPALERIAGVAAVYPIADKRPSNSYAVPLIGGDTAWQDFGNRGENTTIAIIDTGLDYTHSNFGGPGTVEAYNTEHAAEDEPANPAYFPSDKIIGGWDFVGDAYDAGADEGSPALTAHPDENPLDCNGHGSHVGGTAAGLGVNADGSTYDGVYDETTPFDTLKIGPGVAPAAQLYGFRVFGCDGSTDVTGAALEMAADPNGDGDTSDHVDVVNMSLGSDFGSDLDGDSVLVNELSAQVGITMVIASGNGGDLYDVGGSPGNAVRSIAVANSVDAYSQLDALEVTGPAAVVGEYGAQRSIAYDWANSPDLAGEIAQVTDPTNLDSCDPLSPADAAAVEGKIAWVEWPNFNGVFPCGSVARSTNLAAAGAIGFVFAADVDVFNAGISGSATIPGVIITDSAADTLRPQLGNGVTVGGTIASGFRQLVAGDDDLVNSGSSRGIRVEGGVKPDVTAVGTTVFSTGVGTGNEGSNSSGTSMAAPMVAGLAALVVAEHPDWTVEEVKANIMNTSSQNLFTEQNHTGDRYAPNRVGAGRVNAVNALDNEVLAYVTDDPGAVSASFGPLEVTEETTLTKTIKVANKGTTAASYDVSYEALTEIPGVTYSVEPSSVTVAAGGSQNLTVTLHIDPTALTKTIDPTMELAQGGLPREFLADASGRVVLASTGSTPDLRVPVYSAPRPASIMSQPESLILPPGNTQTGTLPLSGTGVIQGTGTESVISLASAFELQAKSDLAPVCTEEVTSGCVHNQAERSADLKYVGTTSEFFGANPITSGFAYFAIATHGPWQTAASQNEFDILLSTDNDPAPEFVTINTRLPDTDTLVSATFDLETGENVDVQAINDAWLFDQQGNPVDKLDTALFDSDVMVLPVFIDALGISQGQAGIDYSVVAFSNQSSDPVDVIDGLSVDLVDPGIETSTGDGILYLDADGEELPITRNLDAYTDSGGLGILVVHYHNAVGSKAEVVPVSNQSAPTNVTLSLDPTSVEVGQEMTATVAVTNTESVVPTGDVTLRTADDTIVGSGSLGPAGTVEIAFTPTTAGTVALHAEYEGDLTYVPGESAPQNLTVTKAASTVTLLLDPTSVTAGGEVTATVTVDDTAGGIVPTGSVTVKTSIGTTLGSGVLDGTGTAVITFKPKPAGTYTVHAEYAGDGTYAAGSSTTSTLTVTKHKAKVVLKVPRRVEARQRGFATIVVKTMNGVTPTGKVVLKKGKKTIGTATLKAGKVRIAFKFAATGTVKLRAKYVGDGSYTAGRSVIKSVRIV